MSPKARLCSSVSVGTRGRATSGRELREEANNCDDLGGRLGAGSACSRCTGSPGRFRYCQRSLRRAGEREPSHPGEYERARQGRWVTPGTRRIACDLRIVSGVPGRFVNITSGGKSSLALPSAGAFLWSQPCFCGTLSSLATPPIQHDGLPRWHGNRNPLWRFCVFDTSMGGLHDD